MKIGIVFAGQGAQYSGMGKDLYDSFPQAKEIFDLAGDQIKEWCFEGDAETLKQTHVTQPTIYTVSMAAYKALLAELEKNGLSDKLEIDAVAGFSLGEYSALTAAGVIPKISEGVEIHLEKHIPQFLREVVRIAGVSKKIHGSHSLRHLMDHAGF